MLDELDEFLGAGLPPAVETGPQGARRLRARARLPGETRTEHGSVLWQLGAWQRQVPRQLGHGHQRQLVRTGQVPFIPGPGADGDGV